MILWEPNQTLWCNNQPDTICGEIISIQDEYGNATCPKCFKSFYIQQM